MRLLLQCSRDQHPPSKCCFFAPGTIRPHSLVPPRYPACYHPQPAVVPSHPPPAPTLCLLLQHHCTRHHEVPLAQQCQEVLLAQLHTLAGEEGQDEGQALLGETVLARLVAVLDLLALKHLRVYGGVRGGGAGFRRKCAC